MLKKVICDSGLFDCFCIAKASAGLVQSIRENYTKYSVMGSLKEKDMDNDCRNELIDIRETLKGNVSNFELSEYYYR